MTIRLPLAQGILAGACLAITACSGPSDASSAVSTLPPGVCDLRSNTDPLPCKEKEIVVQKALPAGDEEVLHLAKKGRFVITYDGANYGVSYRTQDWLPGFLGAAPLKWVEGENLMEYANCSSSTFAQRRETTTVQGVGKPKYTHFASQKLPVHLGKDFASVEEHTWYLYPLKNAPGNKVAYCLSFEHADPDGGSHNGAVHGDGS